MVTAVNGILSLNELEVFVLFVVPGLVSMSTYRLLMPARAIEWSHGLLQGLFYSSLNFVLLAPLIALLAGPEFPRSHPWLFWFGLVLVLLVFPASWPALLRRAFRWDRVARRIQIPYPTAWDYLFDIKEPVFVLVHLNTGALVGGYWGQNSYAGSFPNHGDIYLEAVYHVNERGEFGDPIDHTQGVLLRRDEYSYLELFDVTVEEA